MREKASMQDYQKIIDIASEPMERLFQEEAERTVKHGLCEDKPCLELCRKARQYLTMIVRFCWREYAKFN